MNLVNLAEEAGLRPKRVASTQGGEYHSSCPACAGNDRFIIQPNKQMSKCMGYYFCRKCGINGDSIQFCLDFLGYESFREAAEHAGAVLSDMPERNTIPKYQLQTSSVVAPAAQWSKRAKDLVVEAHENLLCKHDVLDYLQKRGFSLDAVKLYQLGWLADDKNELGTLWGLSEKESIWISSGLVIPSKEFSGTIVRIKVRRLNWHPEDQLPKYVAISGSMTGLAIMGNKKGRAMIVVESELDAYAIHYVAGDLVTIVAVGGCIKNPDPVTDALAKRHGRLLICHDNDDAGRIMLAKWQQLYPHARPYPTPYGKDIGEACAQGFNVRDFILSALPDDCLKQSSQCNNRIIEKESLLNTVETIETSETKSVQTVTATTAKEAFDNPAIEDGYSKQPATNKPVDWKESDHLDLLWVGKYNQRLPRPVNIQSEEDIEAIKSTLQNQYNKLPTRKNGIGEALLG